MRTVIWGKSFVRAFKRMVRKHPDEAHNVERALRQLTADPFVPELETHKLKGVLAGSWACSAGYDLRIVFDFVKEGRGTEDAILLLDIGSHDEVY